MNCTPLCRLFCYKGVAFPAGSLHDYRDIAIAVQTRQLPRVTKAGVEGKASELHTSAHHEKLEKTRAGTSPRHVWALSFARICTFPDRLSYFATLQHITFPAIYT